MGGEVSEVLSPTAFVISEEDVGAPEQGPEGALFVNGSRQAPVPELSVGQSVTVTGRVEEFGLEGAARETGVDLKDEALPIARASPRSSRRRWMQTGKGKLPGRAKHPTQRVPADGVPR